MDPRTDDHSTDTPPPDEGAASALLAKWLIPSAAVLFAVIGYVVQSSQESLLGVEATDHDSAAYFNSAADFLREAVVRLLAWPAGWPHHIFLHRPILMSYAVIVVAVAVMAIRRGRLFRRWGPRTIAVATALAIASVVLAKFLVVDAPLLKIEDLATGGDDACWALVARPHGIVKGCPAMSTAKGTDAVVWREAGEIAGEIVCSRVSRAAAAKLPSAISGSQACGRSQQANKDALEEEFLGNLILELITMGGALAVLRRASHHSGATAICLLALFYGLSTPYAYGKVGMTQLFDFGDARIGQALHDSYVKEDPAIVSEKGWLPGVILNRDAKGASILAMRVSDCPAPLDGKAAEDEQRVSLSYITGAQLMSFDQINKVDLITWLATQQRDCPSI